MELILKRHAHVLMVRETKPFEQSGRPEPTKQHLRLPRLFLCPNPSAKKENAKIEWKGGHNLSAHPRVESPQTKPPALYVTVEIKGSTNPHHFSVHLPKSSLCSDVSEVHHLTPTFFISPTISP